MCNSTVCAAIMSVVSALLVVLLRHGREEVAVLLAHAVLEQGLDVRSHEGGVAKLQARQEVHAFLLVQNATNVRFSPSEAQIIQVLDKMLSSAEAGTFLSHTIIVLNRADRQTYENKEAAALAKKVFKDLDTVQLASSKKLPDVAMKGYKAYTEDMPKLLNALD